MKFRPKHLARGAAAAILLAVAGCNVASRNSVAGSNAGAEARLLDTADGDDWPAFGRTYGEQHFSPLTEINVDTIGRLGLVWSFDLPPGNPASGPIAVDGVLYTATGYSIIRAFDAATGKQLWEYDPKAAEAAGVKLRQGWGIRGLAWWNGKIYTGTQDGRLIAIDAKTEKPLWQQMTVGKDDVRFISGAPRVFDGKVIIGHGGADSGSIRGYVTAYDAETGKQLWRFYSVPGQPGVDTDETTQIAAKTWAGDWWRYGGGGTVWNAITYDKEFDTIYIGTGNGAPWNRKVRSAGQGDNLFLCSIVALDAKTGKYKWHYQTSPGESWDYNSSMDMELADLTINGQPRKVLMHAPKNGFLYVIDRKDGKVISAKPFVPVSWAKGIDLKTGRPIENANIRYESGPVTISPGPNGAHSWTPMAYSPQTQLVYIPTIEMETTYDDRGIPLKDWKRMPGAAIDFAVMPAMASGGAKSTLVAIDPVTHKEAWRVPTPAHFPGGTMATAGGLVFQGQTDAKFNAYDAKTGKLLWSFDAKAPIVAPPITYRVKGRQYVTVIVGAGVTASFLGQYFEENGGIDYRTQPRRILTFALDEKRTLPDRVPFKAVAAEDPDFRPNATAAAAGMNTYIRRCFICHGAEVVAGGIAPDLRASSVVPDKDAFASVVRDGMLVPNGMPQFQELQEAERENLRHYIRTKASELRSESVTSDVAMVAH